MVRALMAMGGSVLGIGTDIAGSIRIPGLCNGVFAFKPSTNRIPYGKQTSSAREGLAGFAAAAGPLARSPRDLELLTSAVLKTDPSKRDPTASFTPWRSVEKSPGRKLRLGLIVEDPTFPLHPPVMRALNTAVDKLKEAGHTIIPLTDKVPNISETLLTAFRFFGMDPKKIVFSHIDASGEPRIPSLATAGLPQPHFPHNYIEPTLENLIQLNVKRGR
ncbi:hypothetical protein H2203_006465 [Taxawa tesnikishii (nom. ined.)]|nr:hypothetical protein H2203_006465 [Dothideales sp. JES 119]